MFDQSVTKKTAHHPIELPQPDNSLHSFQNIRAYIRSGKISWSKITDRRHLKLVNNDLVSREDAGELDGKPFPLHDNVFLSKSKFHAAIVSCFSTENSENAVNALRQGDPQNSAHKILSNSQMIIGFSLIAGAIASAATAPLTTAIAINAFITLYFVSAIFFRVVLLCFSTPQNAHTPISSSDPDLPVITILLPLYKDAASLALLVKSIQSLDYPIKKWT